MPVQSPLSEEITVSNIASWLEKRGLELRAIAKLAGDASSRSYYRVSYGHGHSEVIMALATSHSAEERNFLRIGQFMESRGLPVPRTYAYDSDYGMIALEDLGDELLESLVSHSTEDQLREMYTKAVDLLIELRLRTRDESSACESFNPPFDDKKFTEELRFFVIHFLKGFLKTDISASGEAALNALFERIIAPLCRQPRIFCHRDFHSRNLMWHNAGLVMIDFQDARMGPAQYDLASLLRDSYVTLPQPLVDELIDRYQWGLDMDHTSGSQFCYLFDVMSLQRNLKALGTFGYQISARGADRYRSSIPRTASYISRAIRLHGEFASFVSLVEDYITGPAREVE